LGWNPIYHKNLLKFGDSTKKFFNWFVD
jgi:hypothetical protein